MDEQVGEVWEGSGRVSRCGVGVCEKGREDERCERTNWAASRGHQSHTPFSNAFRTSE
ncbi:MAG: hypothetical protein ACKERG_03305 [Candidatus Hodgkinia cicadicola]